MTIKFKNIKMYFGDKDLFTIDHLTIPQGSRVGIIGDNGSGKTTLFSIIKGDCQPNEGTVNCSDRVASIEQLIDSEDTASGGEQTRKRIQEALKGVSGILLADEPTNHLDKNGINYLEKKLKRYAGTLLIISHNRSFLNKTVNKILAIENSQVKIYEGNYDDYLKQKKIEEAEYQRSYENYQHEKQQLMRAVGVVKDKSRQTRKTPKRMGNSEARLHKMGDQRAKKNLDNRAKIMETRLSKLNKVEKPVEKKKLVIPFSSAQPLHANYLLAADHYNLVIGQKELLKNSSFKLETGSKTALLGVNGSGKTTLMKEILHRGQGISFARGVNLGYFSQSFETLDDEMTIFDSVCESSPYGEQEVRDLLAHMQFRNESVFKKIGVLSGGERSKAAISRLLLSKYNLLLLDEPTNHLDIASIKVLEEALSAYQGTVLFISHDETFIENVATDKWMITDRKIQTEQDKNRISEKEEQVKQQKLLLETRKTTILGRLISADQTEKLKLEAEFQEVLQEIKVLNND
ncbi:ATP-binding cassette domain-containing protein [Enterococcus sp. BWT-B8]|uniref:ribosomal protection-like ABC-F family protein n=1 Tax=Enterococcus sp. BWT-B8 TaxID=2885157 RepID=UPI001E29AE5C|nr:ABC-F family ATP-binding cassette domain-containing protein [Enterococcus sp. BWT-B8]MCB5952979.1 ATP-binding cassette domain-containing protein [Enterococcus sp. BWT-B8]